MKIAITLLAFLLTCLPEKNFEQRLSDAALTLTLDNVSYDPSYFKINYPNGDVPKDRGVCTDVVIRAYRKLGVDPFLLPDHRTLSLFKITIYLSHGKQVFEIGQTVRRKLGQHDAEC